MEHHGTATPGAHAPHASGVVAALYALILSIILRAPLPATLLFPLLRWIAARRGITLSTLFAELRTRAPRGTDFVTITSTREIPRCLRRGSPEVIVALAHGNAPRPGAHPARRAQLRARQGRDPPPPQQTRQTPTRPHPASRTPPLAHVLNVPVS